MHDVAPHDALDRTRGYQFGGSLMRQVTYAIMSVTAATMGVAPCAVRPYRYTSA